MCTVQSLLTQSASFLNGYGSTAFTDADKRDLMNPSKVKSDDADALPKIKVGQFYRI